METPLQVYLIRGELVRILSAGLKVPTCAWVISDGDGGFLTTIIEAKKLRAQQGGKRATADVPAMPMGALEVGTKKVPLLGTVLAEGKWEEVTAYIVQALGLTRPQAEEVMVRVFGGVG